MNLGLLPLDCFAHVLSFACPIDACRISLVSSSLRVSADSDNVWDKFIPGDTEQVISRLVHPLVYSSKKDLFRKLCSAHLIDSGRKIFRLGKATGNKEYIVGARELKIEWARNPLYWAWKPLLQSRFSEVVELRTICWLEIHVEIDTRNLSPNTTYSAYLIVKFADRAYGLDTLPSEISLEISNIRSRGIVYLRRCNNKNTLSNWSSRNTNKDGEVVPSERQDGWIEIQLGRFYNGRADGETVKACLKEVTGEHLKGGLIVEGIELRPL